LANLIIGEHALGELVLANLHYAKDPRPQKNKMLEESIDFTLSLQNWSRVVQKYFL